jgi:hypothetical protein
MDVVISAIVKRSDLQRLDVGEGRSDRYGGESGGSRV